MSYALQKAAEIRSGHGAFLLTFCILVFLVMSLLCPESFPTLRNFTSMAFQFPELGLFSLAVALSLMSGGIDLSVVSTANLSAILAGLAMKELLRLQANEYLITSAAVLTALAVGFLCGSGNSFLITCLLYTSPSPRD